MQNYKEKCENTLVPTCLKWKVPSVQRGPEPTLSTDTPAVEQDARVLMVALSCCVSPDTYVPAIRLATLPSMSIILSHTLFPSCTRDSVTRAVGTRSLPLPHGQCSDKDNLAASKRAFPVRFRVSVEPFRELFGVISAVCTLFRSCALACN